MTDSDQLRLRPAAEAYVSGRLFVLRGRGGSKECTFDDASTATRCHAALREGTDVAALEQLLGWRRAPVLELVGLLEREGLLEASARAPERLHAVVLGDGELAHALAQRMRDVGIGVDDAATDADALVVCVLEHPDDARVERIDARTVVLIESEAHGTAVSTLRREHSGERWLGCAQCRRRHLARRDPFRRHLAELTPDAPPHWRHRPSPPVRELVLGLAIAAVARGARADALVRSEECFVVERTLELVREPIVRAPCCSRCAGVPPSWVEQLGVAARSWQARLRVDVPLALPELGERLQRLRGTRTGLVAHVESTTAAHHGALAAFMRERGVDRHDELDGLRSAVAFLPGRERMLQGEGFDLHGDARSAETLAMVEGLERMFALDAFPAERTFVASHRSLGAQAIDPRELQLYAEHQYDAPGFPYRRFDRDDALRWVVGVRSSDGEPVAVPYDAVGGGIGSLCQATSSGAAAHSSPSLAVLAALVEAVERDAFMVGWANRLVRDRLPVVGTPVQALLERAGFSIGYVDASTDVGLPVVMQVVRDRQNPDFFIANTASGSTPAHALGKLVRELVQVSLGYMRDRKHLCGPATASDDPRAVDSLAQHLQFYQRHDKHAHVDFLDASKRETDIESLAWPRVAFDRPRACAGVLATVREAGFDPIIVDCTPDSLAELGLVVVRAVIPGLAPLESGHLRRRSGGRRLLEAPRRMGLADRDHGPDEQNPWPHPGA